LQTDTSPSSTGSIVIQVPTTAESGYDAAGWKDAAWNDNTTAGTIRFGTNHKKIVIATYNP
jgi:hypothetical protein